MSWKPPPSRRFDHRGRYFWTRHPGCKAVNRFYRDVLGMTPTAIDESEHGADSNSPTVPRSACGSPVRHPRRAVIKLCLRSRTSTPPLRASVPKARHWAIRSRRRYASCRSAKIRRQRIRNSPAQEARLNHRRVGRCQGEGHPHGLSKLARHRRTHQTNDASRQSRRTDSDAAARH